MTSHYAIMHAQEESIKRVLPMPVVVYHMYLKLVHSGETAESVLAMADPEFGTFVSQGWQITCDPGLVPYERDAALGASIGPHLFDNTLVDTENIVSRPSCPLLFLRVSVTPARVLLPGLHQRRDVPGA